MKPREVADERLRLCVRAYSGSNRLAAAQSKDELKETTATILNLNGLLCAKVVEIRPLEMANQYEVTCIEYRGGSGTVRYILNAATGKAFKAG